MNRIDEALNEEKMKLGNIEVPDELEERLKGALNRTEGKKRKGLIAAALILLLVCFYSYDAIAYYGKKIIGYDNTMYGNLKELNEKGRGQEINKSYVFGDGTEIRLDGIIFDDNKLIAFIRQSSKTGFDKMYINYSIKGLRLMEYISQSGAGNFNEERNEISWIYEFEPPAIYEKWMSFEISKIANGRMEEGKIRFTLDRNKAMGHTVKQNIGKTISIEGLNIKFDKITISPIAAVVEGELTGGLSFKGDFLEGGNTDHPLVDFDLIINNKTYNCGTRNMSGSNDKIQFKNESVTVPVNINTIEISNIKYAVQRMVDKRVSIKPDTKGLRVDTDKGDIVIKNVRQDDKSTYITLKSNVEFDLQNNPTLTIFADGKDIASSEQELDKEYVENGKKYKERTFKFDALSDEIELAIKVVYDIHSSSEVIEIPIN